MWAASSETGTNQTPTQVLAWCYVSLDAPCKQITWHGCNFFFPWHCCLQCKSFLWCNICFIHCCLCHSNHSRALPVATGGKSFLSAVAILFLFFLFKIVQWLSSHMIYCQGILAWMLLVQPVWHNQISWHQISHCYRLLTTSIHMLYLFCTWQINICQALLEGSWDKTLMFWLPLFFQPDGIQIIVTPLNILGQQNIDMLTKTVVKGIFISAKTAMKTFLRYVLTNSLNYILIDWHYCRTLAHSSTRQSLSIPGNLCALKEDFSCFSRIKFHYYWQTPLYFTVGIILPWVSAHWKP